MILFGMKFKIMFLLLLIGKIGTAQEISIDLDNFNKIEITRGLKVSLTHSQENKAVIIGNSRDKVKVSVERGILKVSSGLNQLLESDNTLVTIYFKDLQDVEARQNSRVEFCNKIGQPLLILRSREGSNIFANVEVENLVAGLATGGSITVIGKADIQEIDVKAAGDFRGENLLGQNVNIKLTGGGNANINAKNYVNATVRAGGIVHIYGNPEEIIEKVTFGGSIKKIN